MTKINLKEVDPAMMSNTEAIGRVKLESLPAEVTGTMSAVEGAADMAFRALSGAAASLAELEAAGDSAAAAKVGEDVEGLVAVWQQMELDRVALLLHRGLSLQGRAVLEAVI